MSSFNEQISKLSINGFESALRLAQISLDSTERLVKLNLEVAKQSLEDNARATRELAGSTNPQDALTSLNRLTTQVLEQAVVNSRNVYEVISQTQGEYARVAEENIGAFNKTLIGSIESLAKNAPAGSDVAVNSVKSSLAAAAAAVNSFTKAAQQVAEFADTSVKAASNATAEAVKAGAKRAS